MLIGVPLLICLVAPAPAFAAGSPDILTIPVWLLELATLPGLIRGSHIRRLRCSRRPDAKARAWRSMLPSVRRSRIPRR